MLVLQCQSGREHDRRLRHRGLLAKRRSEQLRSHACPLPAPRRERFRSGNVAAIDPVVPARFGFLNMADNQYRLLSHRGAPRPRLVWLASHMRHGLHANGWLNTTIADEPKFECELIHIHAGPRKSKWATLSLFSTLSIVIDFSRSISCGFDRVASVRRLYSTIGRRPPLQVRASAPSYLSSRATWPSTKRPTALGPRWSTMPHRKLAPKAPMAASNTMSRPASAVY